jgi:hypothetical protein
MGRELRCECALLQRSSWRVPCCSEVTHRPEPADVIRSECEEEHPEYFQPHTTTVYPIRTCCEYCLRIRFRTFLCFIHMGHILSKFSSMHKEKKCNQETDDAAHRKPLFRGRPWLPSLLYAIGRVRTRRLTRRDIFGFVHYRILSLKHAVIMRMYAPYLV